MKTKEYVQRENSSQLMEIAKMKESLSELYSQIGPNSSNYISLSIKLDLLVKNYVDERISMEI